MVLVRARMYVVDQAEVVITEQEGVRAEAQDGAGTTVHYVFAVSHRQESCDEVGRLAIGWSELHDSVARADVRMAGSVECDEEGIGES